MLRFYSDLVGSEVLIPLVPSDTESLKDTYYHECWLEDNINQKTCIAKGYMTIV